MTSFGRVLGVLALAALAAAGATPALAQVVINEIHYNPPGDDATVLLEFIELHNAGPSTVDLGAWQLVFGPEPFVFPLGSTIGAGAHLVVAQSISRLQAETGYTAAFEFGGLASGLGNGGEQILLKDAGGAVVDSVSYDDDPPWPAAADGNGPSLELVDPSLDNALSSSWKASVPVNGTPGAQNSVYSPAPRVATEVPRRLSAVETLTSVSVTFSTAVSGVTAGDLTVDGSAATDVQCASCAGGEGAGPYVFTGFAAPAPGSTDIVLAPGSIEGGGVPFQGESWTVSSGLVVVFHEIHYHPKDPDGDAEFFELTNAGSTTANLSGWTIADGPDFTFPAGTTLAPGQFVVVALDPQLLQSLTGYAGAFGWTAGRLSNSGERLGLVDASGNELDSLRYGTRGNWRSSPDGEGPSLELVHARLPNEHGAAWKASLGVHGTPGAQNSVHDATPPPIVFDVLHAPPIPAPGQSVTITASAIDDASTPSLTLYVRQDAAPTLGYTSAPMFDDGLHGDGGAGDGVYGAITDGLADGQRLDFTIRASDGTGTSAAPAGHDTLAAGGVPKQTFLLRFSSTPPLLDFPSYHMITTQDTRNKQSTHNENEYDATFLRCTSATSCEIFYNVVERYRGAGSINIHPHQFRIDFSEERPLTSELGFDITRLILNSVNRDKQHLGYQFFREAFDGSIATSVTQWVRFNQSPLTHGGIQDHVYINVERVDGDFLESQGGAIVPARFPDRCSVSGNTCETNADCPGIETCDPGSESNLYQAIDPNGTFEYLGPGKEDGYRLGYDKQNNEEADVWDDVIDTCFALDEETTPDASYEQTVKNTIDEIEWARWFAIHMLLVNQEGGLWRDTGDDFYAYWRPDGSANGSAYLIPWDMDSTFGGLTTFQQESIWRTTVPSARRFVRSNAFAARFVGAICHLLENDFSIATMNARIDALPPAAIETGRKIALKNFVSARHAYLANEIVREVTIEGLPGATYTSPVASLPVWGTVDQCATRNVTVNGVPASGLSVWAGTWSHKVPLVPGLNTVVVRALDHDGNELARREESFVFTQAPASTVSFQQGAGGYAGATDTYLHAGAPTTSHATTSPITVDGPDLPENEHHGLLRFDALFQSQGGPIPDAADIFTAKLRVSIVNSSVDGADFHRMLQPWSSSATWDSMGAGVQLDNVEARGGIDVHVAYTGSGFHDVDVGWSLRAWARGAANHGWVLRTPPGGFDSWRFSSSEFGTAANRPTLTVEYGCRIPADSPELTLSKESGTTRVQWTMTLRAASHDVVRGTLGTLRSTGGDFASATDQCLANDTTASSLTDATLPAAGQGLWYLARPIGCGGDVGTFDSLGPGQVGSRDAEIATSGAGCP